MTYRERKRLGFVKVRPRKTDPRICAWIVTVYRARPGTQQQIATFLGISQSTVCRIVGEG